MQTLPTEPLVTFNHRYEAIHRVAFGLAPNEQYNKTIIMEYAKKLSQNKRDKLLRKITKKHSYIRTLDDAFKQAIEINRETSFVEAASGHYNDQNNTRIDTQINKLDDSFQECDISAMNTRATNRWTDGSHNGSFDRSASRNSSLNSSYNSRPSYRNNNYSSNNDSYNRQGYNRETTGTGDTNRTIDMIRKAKTTKTGMITIKTGTGSTTEGDQTSTNTTEINPKHKSSSSTQIKTCQRCYKW